MQEIIERLNSLFGDAAPLSDKIHFVNQIASITRESDVRDGPGQREPQGAGP